MENKITDFVTEFNTNLSVLKQYENLEYTTNGFYEAIGITQISLFDDGNYPSEHHRKIALSHLLKLVSDWGEVAGNMFADEIWAWEKEVKEQLENKFSKAKMKVGRLGTLRYKLIISGKYDEETMSDFVDVVKQDFEYMFDGCKLDYEY